MLAYLIRRLLLIVPTLFGIMVVNFLVVQAAPGPTPTSTPSAPVRMRWSAVW